MGKVSEKLKIVAKPAKIEKKQKGEKFDVKNENLIDQKLSKKFQKKTKIEKTQNIDFETV